MELLIVEDDAAAIETYKDNIDSFNKTSDIQINPTFKQTLSEAKQALIDPNYDAAIIDLKLASNSMELEGLEIVEEIEKKLRFPIFIVSGSIAQVNKEENVFLKKRARDGTFKSILSEILSIYQTGITKILGNKGEINNYLHTIFWKHLATSLDKWVDDPLRNADEKHKTLLRYILLHIQEYLELDEQANFENYHPSEIYITPVIKSKVFTGDIVKKNGTEETYIILTPSCDLAQGKAKDILLVEIEEETRGILLEKTNIIKSRREAAVQLANAEKDLNNLISNSFSNKYHFLPKYNNIKAGLINFQKLKSVRVQDFEANFSRIASINGSFTKDIVARFSYYYSRQGSPDFNKKEIYDSLIN